MKFKLFKKEYDLTSRQLFKFIAFIFFVCISAFLSLNMFVQLGHEPIEKTAMIAISIGVEAFKVFLAISLSTAVFAAIYYWKKWMEFNKKNKSLNLKTKKANPFSIRIITTSVSSFLFLILYLVTAFTSLSASLGYALTTINRYSEEHQTVDNSASITALQDANSRYNDTIKSYQDIISNSNLTLKAYDVEIAKVQPVGQEWRTQVSINNKNKLQDKINEYNNKIIDIRSQMTDNDTKTTNLKLAQSNTAGGTVSKSMFELIGNAINQPASKVMFVMIAILSLVIELGIITTSPHGGISEIEEKEIKKEEENLAKKLEDKKKKLALKKELYKKEPEVLKETIEVEHAKTSPNIIRKKEVAAEPSFIAPETISEPEEVSFKEMIPETVVVSQQDFEMVTREIENPKPPAQKLIDLTASSSLDSKGKAELKVIPKKIEPVKVNTEETVSIVGRKKLPTSSVHTEIDSVVAELDKVSEKEYTDEEKRNGLLNLLNDKQHSSLKNKDKIAKLAEDI